MSIVANNKRARYDYEILSTLEAGVVLTGQEVKSAKQGAVSLKGSFVSFNNNQAYLNNCHISPYKQASNIANYNPLQTRKLLLNSSEITKLKNLVQTEGKLIIPLKMKTVRGLIKLDIAVAKSKKRFDKRNTIKKRDVLRDAARDIKQ